MKTWSSSIACDPDRFRVGIGAEPSPKESETRQKLRRQLRAWLQAGVLDQGTLFPTEAGTMQGSPLSPLLANIYLHYVLDEWFEHEASPMSGAKVVARAWTDPEYRQWLLSDATAAIADMVETTDTDASGFGFVIDEDDMASDLDTKVPTQQSVEAPNIRIKAWSVVRVASPSNIALRPSHTSVVKMATARPSSSTASCCRAWLNS